MQQCSAAIRLVAEIMDLLAQRMPLEARMTVIETMQVSGRLMPVLVQSFLILWFRLLCHFASWRPTGLNRDELTRAHWQ